MEKSRTEFEKWVKTQFETQVDLSNEWRGNCYLSDDIDAMWDGWNAAWNLLTPNATKDTD